MADYALLVDPDSSRIGAYAHLIKDRGLEAVKVSDGEAALAMLRMRGEPKLIVTELSMPKMDGFAFLRAVRETFAHVPVLVISVFMEMRNMALQKRVQLKLSGVLAPSMPVSALSKAIARALQGEAVPSEVATGPAPYLDSERLRQLDLSGLMKDTRLDEALQGMCAEVAKSLSVETALVTLVAKDKQWFKAYAGLEGQLLKDRGTPIEDSFCRHAVDAAAMLVVPDAKVHPLFAQNRLVLEGSLRAEWNGAGHVVCRRQKAIGPGGC